MQEAGENYSDTEHTVPELLNRFVADGWELATCGITARAGTAHPNRRRPSC